MSTSNEKKIKKKDVKYRKVEGKSDGRIFDINTGLGWSGPLVRSYSAISTFKSAI